MKIWVDADACPAPIKDILFRAAARWKVPVALVANQPLHVPPSPWITMLQVPRGADVADHEIAERVQAGELVITADVPLAARVVARGARALDPRGELLDERNVGERLAMRDFMDQLRGSGVSTGGPAPFSAADRHAFARALDTVLAAHARRARAADGPS